MTTSLENPCNVANLLLSHTHLDRHALLYQGTVLSYRQLQERVVRAQIELRELGVGYQTPVALCLPNIVAMPVYYYAIISLGAVCIPLNPLLSEREVQYHLEDSGAQLLIAWEGSRVVTEQVSFAGVQQHIVDAQAFVSPSDMGIATLEDVAAELVQVSPQHPAVILYTSGTTGKPKGAILTHHNLLSNATTVAEFFDYTAEDVFFGGLPLFHSFGQTVSMNAVFAAGASVALLPRFTAESAIELCVQAKVSIIAAVPSMYAAISATLEGQESSALMGNIRYGISGGSPLLASTHADFYQLVGCHILEGYGLSEASPVVSFNQPSRPPVIGSVGTALTGIQVQVRDNSGELLPVGVPGQLWVSGPNVMLGYWNNVEATSQVLSEGWLATGDVATIDEQGNIFIVDRLKDMILRHGYSVYPREIEDVIATHPRVRMVAVVGRKDVRVGEEIYAFILPRQRCSQDEQEVLCKEVERLCSQQLAVYKRPRHYRVVDSLPLGATGKVLKRELRQ
ncbi:AMP-binding protein [Rothia sp. P7208]|uniref:AMP-binding protein n=1 Tax=Rothia sp. P7208 TaxID=3402660 RepID=UPI003AC60454